MNKLMFAVLAAVLCTGIVGCQTRITGEKFPEQVFEVKEKVTVDGKEQLITKNILVASGGWKVTARSPLYADEALKGLDFEVNTNGSVRLKLDEYRRDLSTNSVVMVEKMFSGGAQLLKEIGETYAKIAGGGAQAETVLNTAAKAYNLFYAAGGNVDTAKVTQSGDSLTVSDGNTCVTCDKNGNCTTRSCSTGNCSNGSCSESATATN